MGSLAHWSGHPAPAFAHFSAPAGVSFGSVGLSRAQAPALHRVSPKWTQHGVQCGKTLPGSSPCPWRAALPLASSQERQSCGCSCCPAQGWGAAEMRCGSGRWDMGASAVLFSSSRQEEDVGQCGGSACSGWAAGRSGDVWGSLDVQDVLLEIKVLRLLLRLCCILL